VGDKVATDAVGSVDISSPAIRVLVRRSFGSHCWNICFCRQVEGKLRIYAPEPDKLPDHWEYHDCDLYAAAPEKGSLVITEVMAQQLLEALVTNGVTLPERSYVEGELAATKKHLEDLRRLVFDARRLVFDARVGEGESRGAKE